MGISSTEIFMRRALSLATAAGAAQEVPIGAVVVLNGEVIAEGKNQSIHDCDPTAHAEIIALRQAAKFLNNYRLVNADLYVTLEPCLMCMGALIHARIRHVYFGAWDAKTGAAGSVLDVPKDYPFNHRITCIGGILATESTNLLQTFFAKKR